MLGTLGLGSIEPGNSVPTATLTAPQHQGPNALPRTNARSPIRHRACQQTASSTNHPNRPRMTPTSQQALRGSVCRLLVLHKDVATSSSTTVAAAATAAPR